MRHLRHLIHLTVNVGTAWQRRVQAALRLSVIQHMSISIISSSKQPSLMRPPDLFTGEPWPAAAQFSLAMVPEW